MAVLVPRVRTLGIRLSQEEYSSLEKLCWERNARSISDLVRTAVFSLLHHRNHENALVAQVKELQRKVDTLMAEIASFKAHSPKRQKANK